MKALNSILQDEGEKSQFWHVATEKLLQSPDFQSLSAYASNKKHRSGSENVENVIKLSFLLDEGLEDASSESLFS